MNGNGYRAQLRSVVTAAAAPHGYTLTLWTSGALTIHAGGPPSVIEVLLLLAGAVAGYGLVGLLGYGSFNGVLSPAPRAIRLWAALQPLSVGACVLLVYGLSVLVHGWILWPPSRVHRDGHLLPDPWRAVPTGRHRRANPTESGQ